MSVKLWRWPDQSRKYEIIIGPPVLSGDSSVASNLDQLALLAKQLDVPLRHLVEDYTIAAEGTRHNEVLFVRWLDHGA